jgi:zinc protease
MPAALSPDPSRTDWLRILNASAPIHGKVSHTDSFPFGTRLCVERFELGNGLELLVCEDHSAPVVAYHTWFHVGSRHEQPGKRGLAHLFEHLMFNEVQGLAPGEFDRKLEEAGAENNAVTWLDWTQYTISVPVGQLPLIVGLEAERMSRLVLRQPQVESEKDVVMNERRYRVDDDVEGSASELLWATAFTRHAYGWPTIGWMQDIESFTTEDCQHFYRTFYAPNNATLVVVGDSTEQQLITLVSGAYGTLAPSTLPVEDVQPEPAQTQQRRREVTKPTATDKLMIGLHGPALGDFDHLAVTLLGEVLFGGRASRLHRRLVRELELASDVRVFVGPFRDPGLIEVFASARVVEAEFRRVRDEPVSQAELDRACARLELGLLAGLDTADGKAQNIGFYNAVLRRPAGAFERMQAMRRMTPGDLLRAARRYLVVEASSMVFVRADSRSLQEGSR